MEPFTKLTYFTWKPDIGVRSTRVCIYIYIYVVHVMFRLFLSVTVSYDAEIISVTYAREIGITINDDS